MVITCLGWGGGQALLDSNGQSAGIVLNMSQSTGQAATYRPFVNSAKAESPAPAPKAFVLT